MQKKKDAEIRKSQIEEQENREWFESLDYVLSSGGPERAERLLKELQTHAQKSGLKLPFSANTPYINTIPVEEQLPYPGDPAIEWNIRSLIRWNAMAMVVRANKIEEGIGGHISTFASAAALYDVAFNHFLRGRTEDHEGDIVYIQGHAAPGIYARAYLEGRLSIEDLQNFRQETGPNSGLSSYPHPWLMPDFWQFPTVSMGLSPIMAIYQARFNRYLEDRGIKKPSDAKVWAFLGDGECDEPESLGAITLACREMLDNLIFVVNCNLQRLDGPVRGNGKIIQELEAIFRGAGWNVIKLIWGSNWDPLLAKDKTGVLKRRMADALDGDYQKYSVASGEYIRSHFFGREPELLEMVKDLTDEQLQKLRRGGHDPEKIYSAYKMAVENKGSPTVILAKTIKGYGLGEAGEGRNITHQQKKLNEDELRIFKTRFDIPISDEDVARAPFYKPPKSSPEIKYLLKRRKDLGGFLPKREISGPTVKPPSDKVFDEFYKGSGKREFATTMAVVRMISKLLKDKNIGKYIVPIIPDEARTFGMESLFRQVGIYSHVGQLYEPVDAETLLYYKEAVDGQILEEGITEAGSMSSFIAAGTSYATHGIDMIPFFIYYSMFGFQRIGDLVWAAGDMKTKGFLLGGTSGRTTLAGEGLQHQDGQSHLLAYPVPNLKAYDPAFAYELAEIIRDGIKRMYVDRKDLFYYITVMNEPYLHPPMPEGARDGILKGMYKFREAEDEKAELRAQLFGSGAILNEVLRAQEVLQEKYGVSADVWSVTSYKELYRDGLEKERWNMLHPSEIKRVPYISECVKDSPGVFVAASDYVMALPDSISQWLPRPLVTLGTDGYGRSGSRRGLRDFFEVDWRYVTLAVLASLTWEKKIKTDVVEKAIKELEINPSKANPILS